VLSEHGFATLLFDLLTPAESQNQRNVFDITLLAHRLVDATPWARADERLHDLPIGLFGASTGAGAAIVAAAAREEISAVVSRGGRPDLAGEATSRLAAPTLLIVGGEDREVLALNEDARRRMCGHTALHIAPGATHLFEGPGTLNEALNAAASWFQTHLKPGPAQTTWPVLALAPDQIVRRRRGYCFQRRSCGGKAGEARQ
jgi:dienelactone hydrolase